MHEVPRRLPGGGQVRPRLMLDATRLLLSAGKSLYVRHLRSGKTVKLADVPLPKGTTLFPAGFTVGNGRIAWWTARTARGGKKRTADFWAVPVGGGHGAAGGVGRAAAALTGRAGHRARRHAEGGLPGRRGMTGCSSPPGER
ncbi:hypothetical protein [Nonomuraea salmonea]|uniref:hypothetical protein n=1 Tax=Nonomuraea salmonea TaxID=46181 RepID=UPI0031E53EC1